QGSGAGRCHRYLAWVVLGISNELRNCFGRDRWVNRHDQGSADDASNWRDVADEIVIELVVECGVNRVQRSRQQERVAVGRGAHPRSGAIMPARAWSILGDERLTEPLRQALAHQASYDVSRSTRRKTDKARQHLQMRSTGYGEGSYFAGSDVLQRPRYHGKSGLHLSANQIGHVTAPVLDPNPLDAGHRF